MPIEPDSGFAVWHTNVSTAALLNPPDLPTRFKSEIDNMMF